MQNAISRTSIVAVAVGIAASAQSADWPQWRGPEANGSSRETGLAPPLEPDRQRGLVAALAGAQRLDAHRRGRPRFLNVADGNDLALWCVGRAKGDVIWKRPLGPAT